MTSRLIDRSIIVSNVWESKFAACSLAPELLQWDSAAAACMESHYSDTAHKPPTLDHVTTPGEHNAHKHAHTAELLNMGAADGGLGLRTPAGDTWGTLLFAAGCQVLLNNEQMPPHPTTAVFWLTIIPFHIRTRKQRLKMFLWWLRVKEGNGNLKLPARSDISPFLVYSPVSCWGAAAWSFSHLQLSAL